MRRIWCLALTVGFAFTACLGRSDLSAPSTPPPAREVGSALALPTAEEPDVPEPLLTAVPARPGDPAFILSVLDIRGGRPSGIPVDVEGPFTQRFITDTEGRIQVDGPPGHYRFLIPAGCHDGVVVTSGSSGRFGIAPGSVARAEIAIDWRHRYRPAPPVFASVMPYWPVGETVRVRYDIVDRCGERPRAPNRSIATFTFETDNLDIVGDPVLRADRWGYGYVDVVCPEEGVPSLVIRDRDAPSDHLDLVEADLSPGPRATCRSFD